MDLDTAYIQALKGSVLDVIPLTNLNHQDEYGSAPYSQVQFRAERRLQFEECIKAACQAQFKAHRHFGLKELWKDLTTQDADMFPTCTHDDRIWRRSYMDLNLYDFMDRQTPCMIDVSHISFPEACTVCGHANSG
jgi:hypothetical protein